MKMPTKLRERLLTMWPHTVSGKCRVRGGWSMDREEGGTSLLSGRRLEWPEPEGWERVRGPGRRGLRGHSTAGPCINLDFIREDFEAEM